MKNNNVSQWMFHQSRPRVCDAYIKIGKSIFLNVFNVYLFTFYRINIVIDGKKAKKNLMGFSF